MNEQTKLYIWINLSKPDEVKFGSQWDNSSIDMSLIRNTSGTDNYKFMLRRVVEGQGQNKDYCYKEARYPTSSSPGEGIVSMVWDITKWITKNQLLLKNAGWEESANTEWSILKQQLDFVENTLVRPYLIGKGFSKLIPNNKNEKHNIPNKYDVNPTSIISEFSEFDSSNPLEFPKSAIHEYLFGNSKPNLKFYQDRKIGKESIQKIGKLLKKSKLAECVEFLLGITTGGGKTYIWLRSLIENVLPGSEHIVCSPRPNVLKEFINDGTNIFGLSGTIIFWVPKKAIKQYPIGTNNFPEVRIFGPNGKNYSPDPNKINIILASVQDLRGEQGNKSYYKFMQKIHFRTVYVDEAHTNVNDCSKFIDDVISQWTIDLFARGTGTPEDYLMDSIRWSDDNSVIYSRNDLYTDKNNGNKAYEHFPTFIYKALDVRQSHGNVKKFFNNTSDDEDHTYSKFFAVKKDQNGIDYLENQLIILDFLQQRLGVSLHKGQPYSYFGKSNIENVAVTMRHGIIRIPAGTSDFLQKKLCDIINSDPNISAEYEAFHSKQSDWREKRKASKKKTIFITHYKDMEGENIYEWGWVDFMCPVREIKQFFQITGRLQRIFDGKKYVVVFVSDLEPCITIQVNSIISTSAAQGKSIGQKTALRSLLKNTSFCVDTEGQNWNNVTVPDCITIIRKADPFGTKSLRADRRIKVDYNSINPSTMQLTPDQLDMIGKRRNSNIIAKVPLGNGNGTSGKNKVTLPRKTSKPINYCKLYANIIDEIIIQISTLYFTIIGKNGFITDILYDTLGSLCNSPYAQLNGLPFCDLNEMISIRNLAQCGITPLELLDNAMKTNLLTPMQVRLINEKLSEIADRFKEEVQKL